MPSPRTTCGIVAASMLLVLGHTGPAQAQLLSKWGHPVITLGATPYDFSSSGHGNYPGSPGFIPGYGYYPGPGPGTYPWIDGPGVPFDRRKIMPSPEPTSDPRTACLVVKIPAEAELWFDQTPTEAAGSYRVFVTPPLPLDQSSSYVLRARWLIKGYELTRTETVEVRPGGTATVNFLTVDSWTGHAIETAPSAAAEP